MKKLLAALLAISVTAVLVGCGKYADEQLIDDITGVTSAVSEVTETTFESIPETIVNTSKGTEESISKSESVSNTELEINETEIEKNDLSEAYSADKISILGTWYGIGYSREVITFGIDGSYSSYTLYPDGTKENIYKGTYTINNGFIACMFKIGNNKFDIYKTYAAAVIDGNKLMMLYIDNYTEFNPYENSQNINDYFKNVDASSSNLKAPHIYSKEKLAPIELKDIHGKWICFDWDFRGDINARHAIIRDFDENSVIKYGYNGDSSFSSGSNMYSMYQMDPHSIYMETLEDESRLVIFKKCSDTILTKDMLEGAVGADNTAYYESFFKNGKEYHVPRYDNSLESLIWDYYIDGYMITFYPETETERLYPNLTFKYCVFDEYVYAWNEVTYFIIKLKNKLEGER